MSETLRPPLDRLPIQVEIGSLPPLHALESQWRELEGRAGAASFFISWSWIGPWLRSLGPICREAQLLSARRAGRTVGLAVVFDSPVRRLPLPFGRAAHLHETGRPALDAITIEHNDFLLDAGAASAVRQAMLEHLLQSDLPWRELHLRALNPDSDFGDSAFPDSVVESRTEHECWQVDLAQVRRHPGGHLALLSAHKRAHLRRGLRAYSALGPLQVSEAQDLRTANDYFDRLLALHARRWLALGQPSDFDTAHSRRFHAQLIAQGLPRGEVQLLRARAGEHDLGYVYSFVRDGHVNFYQSGFAYDLLGSRHSPGQVTLALAIEHNARVGHAVFDFLGGSQLYKASLATHKRTLLTLSLQRAAGLARLEAALRPPLLRLREVWRRHLRRWHRLHAKWWVVGAALALAMVLD